MRILTSSRPKEAWFLALLAIFISLLYFQGTMLHTRGRLVFPTDDAYIYFQYARQFASGHPFQYNTGDPPSTGATGVLYLLVLTFLHLVGLRGEGLVHGAFFLGALLLAVSVVVAYRIGERLGRKEFGLSFALLFLLNGAITWGYLCGMEVALFTALLLITCYSVIVDLEESRCFRTVTACSFLVLARPEGLVVGSVLVLLLVISRVTLVKGERRRREAFLLPLPWVISLGYLFLNYRLTGQISPTSGSSKGLWVKPTSFVFILDHASSFLIGATKGIFGGYFPYSAPVGFRGIGTSRYFAPLSLLFFLLGSFPFLVSEVRDRRMGTTGFLFASFGLGVLTVAFSSSLGFQNHRYLIPFYPLFLLFLVRGLFWLSDSLSQFLSPQSLKVGMIAFFLLFSLLSQVRMSLHYVRLGGFLRRTVLETADWLALKTEPEAIIGLLDAGAMKYYGRRRIVDLLGLTTTDLFGVHRAGGGSLYEYLASLPSNSRPDYFVLQSSFQERNPWVTSIYPLLAGVAHQTPSAYGPTMTVYAASWQVIEGSDSPSKRSLEEVEGLSLVGSLDAGSLEDERRSQYRVRADYPDYRIPVFTHEGKSGERRFADAGRVIMGSESFVVPTRPQEELTIVMRMTGRCRAYRSSPFLSGFMEVLTGSPNQLTLWVNGRCLGEEEVKIHQDDSWSEVVLRIPGELIASGRTRIEISGRYTSFYYWFFQ